MKNIFATIEYVAEKILEAITGHKNDEQAHPNLSEQINVLSNTKSEYIGKAFISEEILLDATYPIAYCGSVVNSSTMPNTGQFRVQYIPYFANNEGYSVQIAWGVVTNSGLWYRMANGTIWERWENFSITAKTDILITYNQDYEPIDTNLNKIVKNSLGEVIIYFSVKRKDGGIFSGNNLFVVGAIPVGTRPISDMGFCVLGYETGVSNFKPVGVSIYANGSVVVQTDSQVTAVTGVIKYEATR